MEPTNLDINPITPTEAAAPVQTPKVEGEKKKVNFALVTLSLLLLVATSAAIFFAYQNMQLKNELATKQTSTKPANYEECTKVSGAVIQESYPAVCVTPQGDRFTQSVSSDTSTSPSSAIVDTTNWKTYSNTSNSISFKYPENYFIDEKVLEDNTTMILVGSKKVIIPEAWDSVLAPIEIRYNPNMKSITEVIDLAKTSVTPETFMNQQSLVSGIKLYTITGKFVEGYMGGEDFYQATFDAPKGIVKLNYFDTVTNGISMDTTKNIISTFKFTN